MRLALTLLVLASGALGLASGPPDEPRIAYRIRYEAEPSPGALAVEVRLGGIRGDVSGLELRLDPFGEWNTAGVPYLTALESEPPLRARAALEPVFCFERARMRDGLRLAYRIPLLDAATPEGRAHGLLPHRNGALVAATAVNVLPSVFQDGAPLAARRSLTIEAGAGLWIVSGWADPVEGRLETEIAGVDQASFYLHPAPRLARGGTGDARVEVAQLNAGEDTTAAVLELAQGMLRTCAEATGVPRGAVQRVFVTGEDLHRSGGMRTDHGVCLTWNPEVDDTTWRHGVAHELFHEWLPGKLPAEGPELVWFFEGFTQYLSLWLAARGGWIEPDPFAERLLELDEAARGSTALGQVAFGDPSVAWRDGDGPLETLAYDGGALLAFRLDLALRAHETNLAAVLGSWMRAGEGYSLERLRATLRRLGLGKAYDALVARPATFPPTRPELERLGFYDREEERPAHVTYLGVRTDGGTGPGRVLAIDPDGPQASRDLAVGDVILDYGPRRERPLRLEPGLDPSFALGLLDLSPWWPDDGWFAEIERDGARLRVAIEPWLQPGGLETVRRADPEKVRAFLEGR